MTYHIGLFRLALICALGAFSACAATNGPLCEGTLRPFPGASGSREVHALTCGPDDKLYAVSMPGPRLIRFDPRRQRMEMLGNLGPYLDNGSTNNPVAHGVRAPILFEGEDRLWFGTSAAAGSPSNASGYIFSCRLRDNTLQEFSPLIWAGDESVAQMVFDPATRTIYAMTFPGGRLIRYSPGLRHVFVLTKIPEYQGSSLVRLPDGRLCTLDGQGRLYCIRPAVRGPQGEDAIRIVIPAPAGGAAAQSVPPQAGFLALAPDGRAVFGVWGLTNQLFAFHPDAPPNKFPLTYYDPLFPPGLIPGVQVQAGLPDVFGFGGDGKLYYTRLVDDLSRIVRLDPATGRARYLGALAAGEKVIASRGIGALAASSDGRTWLAPFSGFVGAGLWTLPALPEKKPWSNCDQRYLCHKVKAGAIRIDGRLDDPAWQKAQAASNFVTAGFNPQPAKYRTVSRLLWTDTHLIVAHDCFTDGIRTGITERDKSIWDGEAAEMLLCPMGAETTYYEINANPRNALYDSRLLDYTYTVQVIYTGLWATNWSATIEVASQTHTNKEGKITGWSVEMAIPFKDLDACRNNPPRPGTEWTFDLFRAAKQPDDQTEWSAWVSTHADFHRPFDFPKLVFRRW